MHEIKVFMSEEALAQLEDEYIEKPEDLRIKVFEGVRTLAKQAKMSLINKQFVVKTVVDNQEKTDMVKFEDCPLDDFTVPSDPDWIPDNLNKDNCAVYKIKVGDKTWAAVLVSFQLYEARVKLYNDSLDTKAPNYDQIKAKSAICQEQILHDQLIQPLLDKIMVSIDKSFDEEFKELYEDKNNKKKPKPDRTGKKKF